MTTDQPIRPRVGGLVERHVITSDERYIAKAGTHRRRNGRTEPTFVDDLLFGNNPSGITNLV